MSERRSWLAPTAVNADTYLRSSFGSASQEQLRWMGQQIVEQLNETQMRRMREQFAHQTRNELFVEIGRAGSDTFIELRAIQKVAGRDEDAQKDVDMLINGLVDIAGESTTRMALNFARRMEELADRPFTQYSPPSVPSVIEVMPPEKRVGVFQKIGRFLFGD